MIRTITERCIEKQKNLFMCFIDLEKAFDTVKHEKLIETLRKFMVDDKDLRLITNLYWQQRAVVKVGDEASEWIDIQQGVRQGCVLSPDLFSLYTQLVMDELKDMEGVRIGGRNLNNIRYADDMVMIADSEDTLQELVSKLDEECKKMGLRINKNKTESMGVTKESGRLPVNITLEGVPIKQVNSFRYLGSLVSEDGKCDAEIRARIGMAKTNFGKMRSILSNLSLSIGLRLRLLKSYIWSTLLYGCESWTIKAESQRKLEATEMWFLRRMLRVPWTARRTNAEVLQMTGVSRELMKTIRKRQLGHLGHVLRSSSL